MSFRPIPGLPGKFLSTEVVWRKSSDDTAGLFGETRPATEEERQELITWWKDETDFLLRSLRKYNTRYRRSRKWRRYQRATGRLYANKLRHGPSSKRPVAIVVTTTITIVEARETNFYDTVELSKKRGKR